MENKYRSFKLPILISLSHYILISLFPYNPYFPISSYPYPDILKKHSDMLSG